MRPAKRCKTLHLKTQPTRKNPRKPGFIPNDSQGAAQKSRTNSPAISKSYTLNKNPSNIKDLTQGPCWRTTCHLFSRHDKQTHAPAPSRFRDRPANATPACVDPTGRRFRNALPTRVSFYRHPLPTNPKNERRLVRHHASPPTHIQHAQSRHNGDIRRIAPPVDRGAATL